MRIQTISEPGMIDRYLIEPPTDKLISNIRHGSTKPADVRIQQNDALVDAFFSREPIADAHRRGHPYVFAAEITPGEGTRRDYVVLSVGTKKKRGSHGRAPK